MNQLNEVLQEAQSQYQAGHWSEAETLYLRVLRQQPQHIPALSWLAAIAERTGRPETAIAYYEQILALHPNSSETHSNLGSLLCQQGRIEEAIAHHQQALALTPNDADAHYNLGVVFYQDRQLEAAVQHYQQAIALRPDYANAHNNLGVTLCQLQRPQEAIVHYERAVALNPDHANAHNNLGVALAQSGRVAEAIAHYERALALDPHVSNAHDNLGTALKEQGRLEEAIAHYRQAIALKPQRANPHDNLATALQAQGDLEGAIAEYRQAIALEPDYANAYGNLATALKEQGQFEAAIAACEQGLAIDLDNLHLHNAYGGVLADCGDIAGAIHQFEQALRSQPDHADTHLNLGMMLLTAGQFQRGFAEYHWRWKTNQCPNLRYIEALWNGAELHNRVILLTAEQGFGDTIQFIRYASLVAAKGGRVVVACQRALLRLLQTVPGVTRCVDRDRVDVETHVHAPLLDLPLLLETTLETIPAQVPYLSAPSECQVQLQEFPNTTLKIGFVWSTNPANSTSRRRSCDLSHFLSLLEIPGVALYSLQKDCAAEGLEQDRLQDLSDQIRDFADTAAAIEQLDLIISVDTAVAHLAGALGKPVWTLLPFSSDWRWLRNRTDSPWYPTMRLFWQTEAGNWAEVFQQVREALQVEVERPVTHISLNCDNTPRSPLTPLNKGGTLPRFQVPLNKGDLGGSELGQGHESLVNPSERSATRNSKPAIALHQQATQQLRQGDLEAAVLGYRQAINLQPDYALAYSNLGLALKDLGQPEAAIAYFQQAIQLEPHSSEIRNGYGCTLIDRGEVQAAIDQFERAIELDPNHADAHLNLGMALLLLGNFERGFAEYGWRWRNKPDLSLPYPEALWDGGNLDGKTILLTAEQGFGDTIQFVRYAPLVAAKGGRVVLACQKSLVRLLQTIPGVDECIDRDSQSTQTHVHAPLLELPRLLHTTLDTIPPPLPVPLSPHPPIPPSPHFKIGIAWAASPTSATSGKRSCPLSLFLSLLDLPVTLYSLQKQPSEADRALLQTHGIFDLDPHLHDFADTAGAIAQLDLVISVDTAVAHLAGTLGKPVWTLLPFAPDWRWLLHRTDTPWYPTMRLFRQAKAADWAGVFATVRSSLADHLKPQTSEAAIASLPCLANGSHKLKPCRHGVLLFRLDRPEARSLSLYGEWQAGALNLLQHFLKPEDTIVEVGAGIGVHTLFLAQAVGTGGKVWAVEFDRLTHQTLCANLVLNSLTQVHVHRLEQGAIDSFKLSSCRLLFVKEAVQPTLRGALQTIQRCQPVLYLAADDPSPIVALLNPLGYDLYWHRVPWFNPENFDRNPHNDFGPCATNYLFGLPRSLGITVNGMERAT